MKYIACSLSAEGMSHVCCVTHATWYKKLNTINWLFTTNRSNSLWFYLTETHFPPRVNHSVYCHVSAMLEWNTQIVLTKPDNRWRRWPPILPCATFFSPFISCGVKLSARESEREKEKNRIHDDFKYNHKDGYSQSFAFVTLQKFYFFHFFYLLKDLMLH